jgi:diacylglycerol kinase (ATP)
MSRKPGEVLAPFKDAISGVVFTFKTQRHMRFHLYVVLVVILIAIRANVPFRETVMLLFTISLVLVAEMFNSAIEATVDLVSPSYSPLAKFAKDISAGAVLITTIVALVVGSMLMLGETKWESLKISLNSEDVSLPIEARFILGLVVLFVIVVIGKGIGKRGQVLKGGLVSGHAAYAFFIACTTPFIVDNVAATAIAILLAALVAQSRWEAKIHSIFELALGAGVGSLTAVIIFLVVPK